MRLDMPEIVHYVCLLCASQMSRAEEVLQTYGEQNVDASHGDMAFSDILCVGHLILPKRQRLGGGVNRRSLFTSQVLHSYRSRSSHTVDTSDSLYCRTLEKFFDGARVQKGAPIPKLNGHAKVIIERHNKVYELRKVKATSFSMAYEKPLEAQAARCLTTLPTAQC